MVRGWLLVTCRVLTSQQLEKEKNGKYGMYVFEEVDGLLVVGLSGLKWGRKGVSYNYYFTLGTTYLWKTAHDDVLGRC